MSVFDGRPVFLKDVARVVDGPEEVNSYVRHGWGPARGFTKEEFFPGKVLDEIIRLSRLGLKEIMNRIQAVTIAIAKKKGANAVWVANAVLRKAEDLRKTIVPQDMELIVTRNYGLTSNEKVNELVEALAVAVVIVVALLTLGLGWREAFIVAVAVPVVFGLTLAVNMMLGFTINRVTLFALILSLGLLVDDPIVDVENISRHFALRKKATRRIVLEAVSEIRPPLDHRDAGRNRQFSADVLYHRDDGPVHAADGPERAGDDDHVDGRGLHDHAVDGIPHAQAQVRQRRRRRR